MIESPKKNFVAEVLSFIKTIVLFVAIVWCLRVSIIEAYKIPSSSMVPTLQIGDHILVSKLSYGLHLPFITKFVTRWGFPERNDIVVFTKPDDPATEEDESGTNIIKRVVGLPGDTIQVKGPRPFRNGEEVQESFARWQDGGMAEGNFGPVAVPSDHIFLMGDNRDRSKDSRFWSDPFLPIDYVKGRALFIYWSFDSFERMGMIIR